MSDNGSVPNIPGAKKYEKSYNYPLSRGKWDAFEGGVRVPLIVSGPAIKEGSESSIPVSGSDLLPSIIELSGNKKNLLTEIDGGSFADILLYNNNQITNYYPHNPNGSEQGIAGICSKDGRHTVLMPHPERCFLKWQLPYCNKYQNIQTSPWIYMFKNSYEWCKK